MLVCCICMPLAKELELIIEAAGVAELKGVVVMFDFGKVVFIIVLLLGETDVVNDVEDDDLSDESLIGGRSGSKFIS